MSFAYHLYQLNTRQQGLCPSKGVESQHRAYPTFDIPVILLDKVVQDLTLPDGNRFLIGFVGIERGQSCGVSTTFIDSDYLGFILVTNGLAEETQGCGGITFGGQ